AHAQTGGFGRATGDDRRDRDRDTRGERDAEAHRQLAAGLLRREDLPLVRRVEVGVAVAAVARQRADRGVRPLLRRDPAPPPASASNCRNAWMCCWNAISTSRV